jgi:RNA polymerase-binding transcription factor DksA
MVRKRSSKKRLLAERKRTLDELARLRSYMEVGEDRIIDGGEDSVDAAADVYEREKMLAIIQTLDHKVSAIERALKAADKGSYGICEICGQPIDPERLEVMPQTTTCITCQQRLEGGRRRSSVARPPPY